ncbi:unnamed protein product, partial [Symbiodinium pilosum]
AKEYAIALGCLGRQTSWPEAFELWQEMRQRSLRADLVAWNSAAVAAGTRWPLTLNMLMWEAPAAGL